MSSSQKPAEVGEASVCHLSSGATAPLSGSVPFSQPQPTRAEKQPAGIAVIGAGGHAKVVIATLKLLGQRNIHVYDDRFHASGASQEILGVPVVGTVAELSDKPGQPAIIAIGSGEVRQRLARQLPCEWVSVIHPSAIIAEEVQIAAGCFIAAGVIIQPATRIGEHVIVNTAARIDHDCSIGDYSHIAPGVTLTGNVRIGSVCLCGAGATVIPGMTVGDHSTIGAGSVVVKNIPEGVTAFGVPAVVLPGSKRPQQKAG